MVSTQLVAGVVRDVLVRMETFNRVIPELPGVEGRLRKRYERLVVGHLSPAHRVAAGVRCPAELNEAFAATQAAWRFYANDEVTLSRLAGPLIECGREGVASCCDQYALVVLDWCPLHYGGHGSKADRVELAHKKDLGYELLTALAVSDRDGSPLAPLSLELRAADGVHSTRRATPTGRPFAAPSSLDGLNPLMRHVAGLGLAREPVFVIDREADSVGHYRHWGKAGRLFLVRANDARVVLHGGERARLSAVADGLRAAGAAGGFRDVREVLYKGAAARQFVAETRVVLHRPARSNRVDKKTGEKRHVQKKGRPLALRLVVSEVRDAAGAVLARWLLLTNLPASVGAATVALWYYWRWRIESYHKLLKGAGQHAQCWQQETAAALARRLAVAAMAAVVVWGLARDQSPDADEMRQVLVKLSGRQMKRGEGQRGFTEPALMAGLGVLVPMLNILENHDLEDLRRLAALTLPPLVLQAHKPTRPSG